jgi:hypothetical protein
MPGRLQPPPRNGIALPYRGQHFADRGRGYGGGHDRHREPYRRHDRDRRHDGGWDRGGYGYGYAYSPGYLYPYPLVVDPGFYDWGATDYSENQQDAEAGGPHDQSGPAYPDHEYPGAGYEGPGNAIRPEYPEEPQPRADTAQPQRQEYHFSAQSAESLKTEPLKVIFKDGRTPITVQNYMVNARSLTDLDSNHFEKIPLEQIDIAATQEANRSHGIDFQVPVPSRD